MTSKKNTHMIVLTSQTDIFFEPSCFPFSSLQVPKIPTPAILLKDQQTGRRVDDVGAPRAAPALQSQAESAGGTKKIEEIHSQLR